MSRHPLLLALALAAVAMPALAAGPVDQAQKRWKQADACVADANKQVPDHTAEAQRKRDQLANDCMIAHKLQPLTNVAPPAPTDQAPPAAPSH